jgi:hypothetical protein
MNWLPTSCFLLGGVVMIVSSRLARANSVRLGDPLAHQGYKRTQAFIALGHARAAKVMGPVGWVLCGFGVIAFTVALAQR